MATFRRDLVYIAPTGRTLIRYWLPPLLWMAAIFSASTDLGSFQHSSHLLAPVLRWFFPRLSEDTTDTLVYGIRRCAHLSEYAVLAWLFWRGRRKPVRNDLRPWSWREAWLSVFLVFLFAASDEFHQHFVLSRNASPRDVMLDSAGAMLGLLLLFAYGRQRGRW
jgi:VanZ family protein